MQIHEHVLLELCLPVVHRNRVIVPVEAVNESLDGRFVDMTDIGCSLAGLLAGNYRLWLNEAEGVDNDLALYRLDGVNDHSHRPSIQGLERLGS